MSKISLFDIAPPPQIPQVDNKLEQDSNQSRQQLQLAAGNKFINASKHYEDFSNISKINQFQQQLGSSFVLNKVQSTRFEASDSISNNHSGLSINKIGTSSHFKEDFNRYFRGCIENIGIFQEFQKRLAKEITDKVNSQIKQGNLHINQSTINLDFQPKGHKKTELQLKRQLQRKKQQAIQKIRQIQEQRLSLIVSSRKKRNKSKDDKKDVLTEQQRHRLVHLIREKKMFQQSLNKKNQQLIQDAILHKLKHQKQRQHLYMLQNEKKKIKILQSLKQLELRSHERQQILKSSTLKQKRSYSHRKYQIQWNRQLQLEKQQEQDILESIHKKFQFSSEEIKHHYKKYSLDIKKRDSLIKQKQSRVTRSLPKRQKTYFDRIIQQQMQSIKQRNQNQRLKVKQHELKQKVTQYQQLIDKKYKPKVDPSNFVILPLQRAYSSVSLSKEQRVEKGLQYLAIAKELKKTDSKIQKQESKVLTGYSAYKDYLKDRQPSKLNLQKKQFSEIIKKPKENYQELQYAKCLAQGMSAKLKKNADSKLYQSMKNKLLLLDSLY